MALPRLLPLLAAVFLAAPLFAQGPAPVDEDPFAEITPEMQRLLEEYDALVSAAGPLKQTVADARRRPTLTEAAQSLLQKQGRSAPARDVARSELTYAAAAGMLPLRLYKPSGVTAGAPVILYFHGGGWISDEADQADATAAALAQRTGAIVAAPAYRLAPENRFPAAQDDAFAAYRWVVANAGSFGADPRRVAVVGEDAGGNLAVNVSLRARDTNFQAPVHQLLIHPIVSTYIGGYSYGRYGHARPLDEATMRWRFAQAVAPAALEDARLNIGNAKLRNLPRTTMITAEIDPLMFEGTLLAHKLESENVPTRTQNYPGVTHGFFAQDAVLKEARQAQELAAEQLVAAFASAAREK